MSRPAGLYHPVTIGALRLPGNLFLAPVAGYSDRAFRSVCRGGGADFAYTEMVSAEALWRDSEKTLRLLARAENEAEFGVQIFGASPETLVRAACRAAEIARPSLIDINAGCPVPKITKTGAGAALARSPERLAAAVAAVSRAVSPLPVTVKLRSGWDASSLTWREAFSAAVDAGAAAVTLHPRTRAQGYEGRADWGVLAEAAALAAGRVPVFGSGDVFSPEDAARLLAETGADGVMFARGALGNPFVFRETRALLETGAYAPVPAGERLRAALRELELLIADAGERTACREMRKRFSAYTKGLPGSAGLRARIVAAETEADYRAAAAAALERLP